MKNSLPALSTFVLLMMTSIVAAQTASVLGSTVPARAAAEGALSRSADGLTAGDRLLVQATTQLERRRSVTARLSHQVFLGERQLGGRGSYWQQGSGEDLRVRLELQIIGQDASLLQVSNNPYLWFDRRLPTGRTVVLIDLRQIRADPVLTATNSEPIHPGEANWTSQLELTGHCGGLPQLLAALGANFSFLPPQAMRLVSPGEAQPTSVPFFAVVGHWKPEKLNALLEPQVPGTAEVLPERLPQEVLLLFGQGDLFPYRIEYRRLETPLVASQNAPPIPYQLSTHPMVVLELSDVAFDVPIAAGQFDYVPRDVEWVDQTATLLERLRRERQAKVARADAAPTTMPTR